MKKFLSYAIFTALIVALAATAYALGYTAFPDVPEGSYYQYAAQNMNTMGIMKGYPNGNFGPNDGVNRAQLATVVDRYHDKYMLPAYTQIAKIQAVKANELRGESWMGYLNEAFMFDVRFSYTGSGGPIVNLDNEEDFKTYQYGLPEGWVVAYDGTEKIGGVGDDFGYRIVAMKGYEAGGDNYFYIWYNPEIGGGPFVQGFFMDDVTRLVAEAKQQ